MVGSWLAVIAGFVALVIVTRFLLGRMRLRELDRDFSLDVPGDRERAIGMAVRAARGVMWQVTFTDNGLYTRHIFAHNVIHVAVSDHPQHSGRSTVKVWTRCRYPDDSLFFLRPKAYQDTRRKRDKIIRMVSALGASRGGGRDATIS